VVVTAVLVLLALLAVTVAASRLANAAWTARSPALAVLLWQALGLAGGVLLVELVATLALAPAGDTHATALRLLLTGQASLPLWAWVPAVLTLLLAARLLGALVASTARTLGARRRHRELVDLVATRNPLLGSARVVDSELPVAYCLPGLRPRVVLSRGVLQVLREEEVRAVLAHEAAHVDQRHDLVVLPFVALQRALPGVAPVSTAVDQVAALVEMLADDVAARRHDRQVLARALWKVGTREVPAGGLGATGDTVLRRASRLVGPPAPLSRAGKAVVLAAVAVVLALPPAGLVLPVALG
jgi:Zn-dependent protease with chaperone function